MFVYESRVLSLFHIKSSWDMWGMFPGEYFALIVNLDFHISRETISLDTSDFTQYIDKHSKPARPVRNQSFISFSLRSGSLIL